MLLLLACTGAPDDTASGDDTASTDAAPTLETSRACLVPADADPADYTRTSYAIEVAGRVIEVGSGAPPGGCRDRGEWVGGPALDWSAGTSQWLTIEAADGALWYASATNPWIPDPTPLESTEVVVSYRSLLDYSQETELAFTSAELEFYLGTAPDLSALAPPSDVTLTVGAIEREFDDECGHHALRSLVGDRAGDVATIVTDGTHGFDGIGVWSGGIVEDIAYTCPVDTTGAYAAVFEWTMP
jgi:hypothetical protein